MSDADAAFTMQSQGTSEVDWHLDFSLKPKLFDVPLRTNIVQFNAKGGYEKKKPDLVVNHHDDVNAPFILHGEPKVWFGGDWQPTIQKLKDDLDKLDLSFNYGVCKVPVMIVVYDPQGLPAPKGVSIPAICAELATHPNVKVLEYPVDMCQPPASSQGAR